MTQHPNGCVVPHHLSEGTRQRQLGEAGESTEIHKWNAIFEANPKRRQDNFTIHWYVDGSHRSTKTVEDRLDV